MLQREFTHKSFLGNIFLRQIPLWLSNTMVPHPHSGLSPSFCANKRQQQSSAVCERRLLLPIGGHSVRGPSTNDETTDKNHLSFPLCSFAVEHVSEREGHFSGLQAVFQLEHPVFHRADHIIFRGREHSIGHFFLFLLERHQLDLGV